MLSAIKWKCNHDSWKSLSGDFHHYSEGKTAVTILVIACNLKSWPAQTPSKCKWHLFHGHSTARLTLGWKRLAQCEISSSANSTCLDCVRIVFLPPFRSVWMASRQMSYVYGWFDLIIRILLKCTCTWWSWRIRLFFTRTSTRYIQPALFAGIFILFSIYFWELLHLFKYKIRFASRMCA